MCAQSKCIGLEAGKPAPFRNRDLVLMHLHESIRIASEMKAFNDLALFSYFIGMSAELIAETDKDSLVRRKEH